MKQLKVLMFALALSFAASADVVDTNSQHFYLFTYFINLEQERGARIAISSDGVNWQKINNEAPIFPPIIGQGEKPLCRDPYTCYDPRTGVFHLVWTSGWIQQNIGYAAVKDLRDWDKVVQEKLKVSAKITDCKCTWAPEIFRDTVKDSFMIYWSTERGTNGKRSYYCMTKDFKNFSDPVLFFDPGYSVIDDDILKVDSATYYMFFKDERDPAAAGKQSKNLHYVYGPTPQGPWNQGTWDKVSPPISTPGCEGPCAIKIGTEYRVYFDPYYDPTSTYRMLKVTNLAATTPWPQGDVLKTASGNFLYSHGHIIEIPRVKVMQLLYGAPDTTIYPDPTWVIHFKLSADKYPLGKQNCGCGTGVGLAFFPPLWFKAMAYRKRKKKKL
jgi:hypothetical protein